MAWDDEAGVVRLPGGARVRGRRLRDRASSADFALVLAAGPVPAWPHRRLRWPDFWIPLDSDDALDALRELHRRALAGERVEVACGGGPPWPSWTDCRRRTRSRGSAGSTTRGRWRRRGSAGGCAGCADRGTHSPEGTQRGPEPLRFLHNYTGGEWSRLRSGDQGKRAEEGNDELVNHPLQTTQAPIPISARTPSLPDGS
jgi:hypothetical protein